MGSGKTSASITYMNEHKEERFIYITPYLNEAERIKNACREMHFIEPSNRLPEFHFNKSEHTASLIREGKNIATTHQAFKRYNPAMLDDIKAQQYTLIIDENVDILESFDYSPGDLQMAIDAGMIREENGVFCMTDKKYEGEALRGMFGMLASRDLIRNTDPHKNELYFWTLPPDLVTSFKDVFVLTYLFDGQSIHHFLNIYDIPYERIGIENEGDGTFRFGPYPGYTPEYVCKIHDILHILYNDKMNELGDDYHALSMNWFNRKQDGVAQLKNNISNYYKHICGDIPADRRLWGTYNGEFTKVKGKGYTKSFLTFNAKATNEYRNRDCLVYIANVFMNVNEKSYYQSHGIDVNEDMYALSIMIQWIWRSAIRDGREIYIYVPSKRMRTLLENWMDEISKGGVDHG